MASVAVPEPALREEVREPYDVLLPYSKYHDVERPFGFTEPPSVADVGPTAAAGPVTAVGGLRVVNVLSAPATEPASLVATILKWYVVPGVRPLNVFETFVEFAPDPALDEEVFVPYAVVVPISK